MIVGDVIAHLVTLFDGAVDVPVFDGPNNTAVNYPRWVLVASTAEIEDGATVTREGSEYGPGTWLDESGEVVCSAWAQSGDADIAAQRNAALALADACMAAVHADRHLGGFLQVGGVAVPSGVRLQMRQTEQGAVCRAVFTVTYHTTLVV